ncbi:MAG: outer membrane lipoprotein-sorting protein [Bacteroidota bacterium]|nr:outer membrane lipoprotein-sorting protein [Bacteroidota bacterium]MDP4213621.1 outer membrane lipoprotein-sorting protein [Bacteroidota bacterium]MDP4248475.1 outer membrane lipoprotein-sorting protein [Bacteroidota bacterium]
MKMVKSCLALILTLAVCSGIRAQTADEIINKYFDAIGGKDKIAELKSFHSENTVDVMGNEGPSSVTILNDKGYRLESEFSGKKIIQVITDKGGWAVNPMMGSTTPQVIPDEMYKQSRDQIDMGGPLYNYAAKGNKVELQGTEAGAYKLKVTSPDSVETTIYIDSATHFMTKVSRSATVMGQSVEVSSTFSDYKKTDFGVLFPFTVEISYGGQFSLTSKANKIEINQEVDPKIFEMPKS